MSRSSAGAVLDGETARLRRVPAGVSAAKVKAMATEKIRRWKRAWPCTWSVPNVGQERLLKYLERRPYPKDLIFLAGNGVGKSHLGVKIIAGICFGPKGVSCQGMHKHWKGERHYEAWTSFRERAQRENRPIFGRIIAASDSLKGNGPMIQRIKRLWPKGLWEGEKNGQRYYSEFYLYDRAEDVGQKDLAIAVIDVKTHMQDPDQHRGADLDFILMDEPVPPDVYEECVGRTRANPDAVRIFTITPLEMSGWLIDALVDGADGMKVAVVYGSIWDNCIDWHPDPVMWSGEEIEVGEVLTRGHLEKRAIDDMIDKWTRMSPDTVESRVWGKPTHLSGAVYKVWDRSVHMVDEIVEPWEDWPVWCVIDPHHARPPAVTWWAQGPAVSYLIGEYPFEDYTKIGQLKPSHQEYVAEMFMLEEQMGVANRVIHRWADPNSMKFVYADDGLGIDKSLQGIYSNAGMWFDLANDNLRVGHEALSELLFYHKDKELGPFNCPRLKVLKVNMASGRPMFNFPVAMERYGYKRKALETNAQPSGNMKTIMDETYKDFADCGRYFAMSQREEPFQLVSQQRSLVDVVRDARGAVNKPLALQGRAAVCLFR